MMYENEIDLMSECGQYAQMAQTLTKRFIDDTYYVAHGLYADHLKRWFRKLNHERIHIVIYEALLTNRTQQREITSLLAHHSELAVVEEERVNLTLPDQWVDALRSLFNPQNVILQDFLKERGYHAAASDISTFWNVQ